MPKSKTGGLPSFDNLNDLVGFFDTHDMGDYWERMPEVQLDANVKRRRHLVAIDEEISARLTKIAKAKKISSETLINSWLKEKIRRAG